VVLILCMNLYQVCRRYQPVVSANCNHMRLLRDDRMVRKIEGFIEQTTVPSNRSGKLRYRFQMGAH